MAIPDAVIATKCFDVGPLPVSALLWMIEELDAGLIPALESATIQGSTSSKVVLLPPPLVQLGPTLKEASICQFLGSRVATRLGETAQFPRCLGWRVSLPHVSTSQPFKCFRPRLMTHLRLNTALQISGVMRCPRAGDLDMFAPVACCLNP